MTLSLLTSASRTLSVLHLIETAGRGGAESIVLTLASQRGERAKVATLRAGWLTESLSEKGIGTSVIPYTMHSDALLTLRIARLIDRARPDVVHCHCFTMNTLGGFAALLAGVPSIATVHGAVYDLDRRARLLAYRLAGRMHYRVVTVSNYLLAELQKRAGVHPDRMQVIYNGVPAHDATSADGAYARSRIGIEESDLLVGCVGMLRPEKGHIDLVDAVALARKSVPGVKLLIVGDGKCKDELCRRVEERGMEEAVLFFPSSSSVISMLSAMDVFALPSHTEGLSIATIEAMSCGRPVVVTDCGGPTEIVSNGVTGLIVPPCDPGAMAEALVRLAKDSALRTCLAANGRARAREVFSVEHMLDRYEELYEEAAR